MSEKPSTFGKARKEGSSFPRKSLVAEKRARLYWCEKFPALGVGKKKGSVTLHQGGVSFRENTRKLHELVWKKKGEKKRGERAVTRDAKEGRGASSY